MPAPLGNSNAAIDYVGQVIGHFTIIENMGRIDGRRVLKCRCVCGNEVVRRRDTIYDFSSCGCEQRKNLSIAMRGTHNVRGHVKEGQAATEHPTPIIIGWAAGIWEGEGSISGNWFTRADGQRIRLIQATVAQKDPWILERFRELFGGHIRAQHQKGEGIIEGRVVKREGIIYSWTATGPRARGFLMTIWKFLSPRRHEQILKGFSFRD